MQAGVSSAGMVWLLSRYSDSYVSNQCRALQQPGGWHQQVTDTRMPAECPTASSPAAQSCQAEQGTKQFRSA